MTEENWDAICELYRSAHTERAKTEAQIADWAFAEGLIRDDERGALCLAGI